MENLILPLPARRTCALLLADGQVPFHDRRLWRLLLRFAKDLRPDFVVSLGDDAECYHWSRYEKSPLDSPLGSRAWNADSEIRAVQAHWLELHAATPKSSFLYTLGNHESRVRLAKQRTDSISQTVDDTFTSKFQANRYWNHIVDYGYGIKLGHLWATHGETCTAYAARRMLQDWGTSVVFGHTHKASFWCENPKGDHIKAAWSIPCHCVLDPHYVTQPGWVQGFGVVHFQRDGRFNLQRILVVDNGFMFGSHAYQG